MCIRKEVTEFYQPLADLHEEFAKYAVTTDGAINPMPDLAWAGTRTYYGLLENA